MTIRYSESLTDGELSLIESRLQAQGLRLASTSAESGLRPGEYLKTRMTSYVYGMAAPGGWRLAWCDLSAITGSLRGIDGQDSKGRPETSEIGRAGVRRGR